MKPRTKPRTKPHTKSRWVPMSPGPAKPKSFRSPRSCTLAHDSSERVRSRFFARCSSRSPHLALWHEKRASLGRRMSERCPRRQRARRPAQHIFQQNRSCFLSPSFPRAAAAAAAARARGGVLVFFLFFLASKTRKLSMVVFLLLFPQPPNPNRESDAGLPRRRRVASRPRLTPNAQ